MTKKKTSPNRALLVLCMAAFLVPFMGSAINLALPDIGRRFDMSAIALTWLSTTYLISTAIFQIPFARLADIVGRRKIFITGVVIYTLSSLASGFASSSTMLVVMRAVDGMGSAMMFGTNIAIISALFPGEGRAKALAINVAVVYAALAAGPFFGGILTHHFGWQSPFFVAAGIGLMTLLLALRNLHGDSVHQHGQKFDYVGAVLYGVGLAGVIYGFSNLPAVRGFVCLAAGAAGLASFAMYEKKQSQPLLNMHIFSKNRVFTLSSLAALINYASTTGITFMLSLYLQFVRGLDASYAGRILISQALVQSAFSLVAGSLSARIAPGKLATAGMIVICGGLGALFFVGLETPLWMIVSVLVLFGVGFGIFSSPNTNVIMGSVEKKFYSQASAVTGTMRLSGQAFSMGIAGMAISFMVGAGAKIVPALHGAFLRSMHLTFAVFLILCLIGVFFSLARRSAKETSS